jgi:hypothetical protein
MPNNSFRFNTDTATAYLIREAALRQGRTVADVIRRAVEQHIDAHAPSATPMTVLSPTKAHGVTAPVA